MTKADFTSNASARRPRRRLDLKSGRTYRADPVLDPSRSFIVHIKEMRHCRSHGLDARVIEFHANLAMGGVSMRETKLVKRSTFSSFMVNERAQDYKAVCLRPTALSRECESNRPEQSVPLPVLILVSALSKMRISFQACPTPVA